MSAARREELRVSWRCSACRKPFDEALELAAELFREHLRHCPELVSEPPRCRGCNGELREEEAARTGGFLCLVCAVSP